MSSDVALRVEGITKRFSGVTVLDGVSFEVKAGETVALMGENGAGKSTLIKCLSGIYQPDAGSIYVDGAPVHIPNANAAHQLGIATIHQELNLANDLNVAENIFLGSKPQRRVAGFVNVIDFKSMYDKAAELLRTFGSNISPRTAIADLTTGEKQLIEILKALRRDVKILIMDEPTSALEDSERKQLFNTIHQLQDRGVTIIYISHHMEEVFSIAHNAIVLRDGRKVDELDVARTSIDQMIKAMIGRELEDMIPRRKTTVLGNTVLKAVEVGSKADHVRNISFELREGAILGVAGLAGSGKSDLLRLLFGVDEITEGHLEIRGQKVGRVKPREVMEMGMALIPKERKAQGIFPIRSLSENISIAALRDVSTGLGAISRGKERQLVSTSIKQLNVVGGSISDPVSALSGGNQQKSIIGRWLLTKPKILLLDEPGHGVDVGAKAEIFRIIEQFAEDGGAVLIASSEVRELIGICDSIMVMRAGEIITTLDASSTTQEEVFGWAVKGEVSEHATSSF